MVTPTHKGNGPAHAHVQSVTAKRAGRADTRRNMLVNISDDGAQHYIYKSIKIELIRLISGGKIQSGMALPTERELSERYGVSIGTVRRAMSDLVAEKVLVRQQGRGTFVAPFDSSRKLNSFWHIVRKDGVREIPIVQTLRFERMLANTHTAVQLNIPVGAPIFKIFNLMLINGRPVLLDNLHIPQSLFPKLTKSHFIKRDSTIYDFYRNEFSVIVAKTVDHVSAIAADADAAHKLEVAPGTPLLDIVRVAYTFEEQPIELRRSLLLTEKHEFVDVTEEP